MSFIQPQMVFSVSWLGLYCSLMWKIWNGNCLINWLFFAPPKNSSIDAFDDSIFFAKFQTQAHSSYSARLCWSGIKSFKMKFKLFCKNELFSIVWFMFHATDKQSILTWAPKLNINLFLINWNDLGLMMICSPLY